MKWKKRLYKFNTLRNQILLVFLAVMIIVLCFVGIMTFHLVSALLKNNAEKQIEQTVMHANGRLEALYKQIGALTNQVATNIYVQQLFLKIANGYSPGFREKQELMHIVNTFQAYSDGIHSFEFYTNDYKKIFPLDEENLGDRVGIKWIRQASEAKGKMVWVGRDPKAPGYFLALRQIRLMDRWFSPGGYLLVRVNQDYFQFNDYFYSPGEKKGYIILMDSNSNVLFSNYHGNFRKLVNAKQAMIRKEGQEYLVVKQLSGLTGWTLVIVTPVKFLTEGVSILKNAIILSGTIGFCIFLIFSFSLSTMITQPILRLTKIMQRGRNGELRKSPPISSTVEINELNETYNALVENIKHLIQVVYEKELVRSRAELKALQAQINPHFLFNTLDALYWSLVEKEEEELSQFVLNMSQLFRYIISSSKHDEWVTLREEIEHIRRYMEIMKLRWGDRLIWDIVVPARCLDVRIPKLLIQPLVENAVLHGIGNKMEQGSVLVTVEELDHSPDLLIKVIDDGVGMDEKTLQEIEQLLNKKEFPTFKGSGMCFLQAKNAENCSKKYIGLQLDFSNELLIG
ncbi:sensor histidine kinase [Parageobacillus thermoglucosidasius]|uniref:cache domain-containing sensor histidine kinase n=2 Tax=Parageobacillus thermoglucosidasius TaxID=1426 RepID=UPI002E236999|nr:sensor histidine kinase [Parageobacillus thermoglucosidasius]MED4913545.1 sensor histidine kinase [Parageobacillus thermoglucosidasius]MED4947033.1 sensor histidine kinase [Parageobacillus thermoglucosidasius]